MNEQMELKIQRELELKEFTFTLEVDGYESDIEIIKECV